MIAGIWGVTSAPFKTDASSAIWPGVSLITPAWLAGCGRGHSSALAGAVRPVNTPAKSAATAARAIRRLVTSLSSPRNLGMRAGSVPAGRQWPPGAAPVLGGRHVELRRHLLHLRNVVGGPDLLILLIGGRATDEGAIAARSVGVDVDRPPLALGEDDRVLRQGLEIRDSRRRVGLEPGEAGRRKLALLLLRADACTSGHPDDRRQSSKQRELSVHHPAPLPFRRP